MSPSLSLSGPPPGLSTRSPSPARFSAPTTPTAPNPKINRTRSFSAPIKPLSLPPFTSPSSDSDPTDAIAILNTRFDLHSELLDTLAGLVPSIHGKVIDLQIWAAGEDRERGEELDLAVMEPREGKKGEEAWRLEVEELRKKLEGMEVLRKKVEEMELRQEREMEVVRACMMNVGRAMREDLETQTPGTGVGSEGFSENEDETEENVNNLGLIGGVSGIAGEGGSGVQTPAHRRNPNPPGMPAVGMGAVTRRGKRKGKEERARGRACSIVNEEVSEGMEMVMEGDGVDVKDRMEVMGPKIVVVEKEIEVEVVREVEVEVEAPGARGVRFRTWAGWVAVIGMWTFCTLVLRICVSETGEGRGG